MKTSENIMFVAPGFEKKSGYYFRCIRDKEILSKVGFDFEIVKFSLSGIVTQSGDKISFLKFFQRARHAEKVVCQNVAMVLPAIVSKGRRYLVLHGSLDDLNAFRFSRIKKVIYNFLLRYAVKRFDYVLVVSKVMGDFLVQEYSCNPGKIVFSPNLPGDVFYETLKSLEGRTKVHIREELCLSTEYKYICYSGNSQTWQNLDLLAELFNAVYHLDNSFRLLILSNEPERVVEQLNFGGVRHCLIKSLSVPNRDVPKYLLASDFLYVIRQEDNINRLACPTKAVEYLISGTPILCSRYLGDISEECDRLGAGLIYRGSIKSFASSIVKKSGRAPKLANAEDTIFYNAWENLPDEYRRIFSV